VSKSETRDTGTACGSISQRSKESSTIYATMLMPGIDPDVTSSATEKEVGRRGSYDLLFVEGHSWESYKASYKTWQLSLLAYPRSNKAKVAWPHGIIDWINAALEQAQQSSPRCRGPIP